MGKPEESPHSIIAEKPSDEFIESFCSGADCWFWEIDLQGRFRFSNGRHEDYLGIDTATLQGVRYTDLLAPGEPGTDELLEILSGRRSVSRLGNFKLGKSKKPLFFRTDIHLLLDDNGQPRGFGGLDYPQFKNTGFTQISPEIDRLFFLIQVAVLVVTPLGIVQTVNQGFTRLFGYAASEIVGQPVSILEPDEIDQDCTTADSINRLNQHGHLSVVRRRRTKSGQLVDVAFKGSAIRDNDDNVTNYVGSYQDLSDIQCINQQLADQLKHSEHLNRELAKSGDAYKQLAHREERLHHQLQERNQELLEAQRVGRIGSWKLDVTSGEVTWTDELYQMLNLNPSKPPPNYEVHSSFFKPDSWAILEARLERAIENGEPYEVELEHSDGHGRGRWMMAKGEPVKDADGKVIGLRGVAMDISDRKNLEIELHRKAEELRQLVFRTVDMVSSLDNLRDPYTAGHEQRVAKIADAIAEEMGLDTDQREGLVVGSQLHDIGKITVPSEILVKPTKLLDIEMEIIRRHTEVGADILKVVHFPWPASKIARQHHERMDGSGYPDGLKGDEIILEARIVGVADVVESMASHRPYRPALGIDAALEEIEKGRGKLYDARVADACLTIFRERGFELPEP